MIDDRNSPPPIDNFRTLLYHLGQALDVRLSHYRRGTIYESVRPSDVRVFVAATRKRQTISDIAREIQITRQAAQTSVRRLQKLQVLDLEAAPNNKRDKIVVVTSKGQHARKTANAQIQRFEAEFAEVIGASRVEQFRSDLVLLLDATKARNQKEDDALRPQA
jgi:DNA-binding MarR family transcriptional regulator